VSTAALRAHDALLPQAPGGNAPGAALALVIHVGLIAALSFSIDWTRPTEITVAAELWSSLPPTAPPVTTAPPPPPAPTPAPTPAPLKAEPARPDAQIATERAKREDKLKEEKLAREKAEKLEREKAEKLKREQQAEDKRIAQAREENLRRLMGQVASAAAGTPNPRPGNTPAEGAPSREYAGKIAAAIYPNIIVTEAIAGNPRTEVEVRAGPNGSIISRRIVKPSNNKDWDEAVLKAIDRTASLPRDTDGRVQPVMIIGFTPQR
jgi:colicin import membrane protein